MMNAALNGKPYAGNPHMRFDGDNVASCLPTAGRPVFGKTFMLATIAFATILCECSLQAADAETVWKGNPGVQEWSEAENWTDGVPTGSMTARFTYNQNHSTIALVPPLDFTGLIMTTNAVIKDGWNNIMPTILTLTVTDGSVWKVSGSGVIVATPGIAARIDTDFIGVIDVRAGQSFAVTASINPGVQFIGTGILILDSADRLACVSGFSGTLILPDGAVISPTDTVQAQQHELVLGNGGQVNFAESVLAYGGVKQIEDWNHEGWTGNGKLTIDPEVTAFDLEDGPPQVNAAGELELITDCAQIRTAWYTKRRFKLTDAWAINFTWTPSMPADSKYVKAGAKQTWCGEFGIFLQDTGTDNIGPHWRVPAASAYGITICTYRSGSPVLRWNLASTADNYGNGSAINEKNLGGVTFDKPIDFAFACVDGLVTLTMKQGTNSFSMQKDFKENYLVYRGKGVYVGIGGGTTYWDDTSVPWHCQVISNFSGWYRAMDAGAWTEELGSSALFPFQSSNCYVYNYNLATEGAEDPSTLFKTDGSFKLMSSLQHVVTCGNLTPFAVNKRHLMSLEIDWGAWLDGKISGGFGFAFEKYKPQSGWRFDSIDKEYCYFTDYNRPIGFYTRHYQKQYCQYYDIRGANPASGKPIVTDEFYAYPVANSHAQEYVVYDPDGTFRRESAQAPTGTGKGRVFATQWTLPTATMNYFKTTDGNSCDKNNFYLAFRAISTWGGMETTISSLKMYEMSDNSSPWLSGAFAVKDDATATLNLNATYPDSDTPVARAKALALGDRATLVVSGGSAAAKLSVSEVRAGLSATLVPASGTSVSVGSVSFVSEDGPGTGLKLSGSVSLPSALTIVVPANWRRQLKGDLCLLDLGTVVAPSSFRIVDDAGRDLTAKAKVSVRDSKVYASFDQGLVLLLK